MKVLVGVLLLLVAAALLWPSFQKSRRDSQLRICGSHLSEHGVGGALEMYAMDWEGDYPSRLGVLTPTYLRSLPLCPACGEDTCSAGYVMAEPCGRDHPPNPLCQAELHRLRKANEKGGVCPVTHRPYPFYSSLYTVVCSGTHHQAPNYPQYGSLLDVRLGPP